MKLSVQHRDIRSTDPVDTLIEEHILALQPRLQIDEAVVRLEDAALVMLGFTMHASWAEELAAKSRDPVAEATSRSDLAKMRSSCNLGHSPRSSSSARWC